MPLSRENDIRSFANTRPRFRDLGENLKRIAIDVASEVLELEDDELLAFAREMDLAGSTAPTGSFVRFNHSMNGGLLETHRSLRTAILETNHPRDEIESILRKQLRTSIASRLSGNRLAKELGHPQTRAYDIIRQEGYQAAIDLCWQAVRELS